MSSRVGVGAMPDYYRPRSPTRVSFYAAVISAMGDRAEFFSSLLSGTVRPRRESGESMEHGGESSSAVRGGGGSAGLGLGAGAEQNRSSLDSVVTCTVKCEEILFHAGLLIRMRSIVRDLAICECGGL